MLQPQPSAPRKHRRSEQERHLPQLKKQKLNHNHSTGSQPQPSTQHKCQHYDHPIRLQPPAEFWDNLSKIWLTKRAVEELDRRNSQARFSSYRRTAEWKESGESRRRHTRSAAEFLSSCSVNCLQRIKLFARHGGPSLSDLIGYRSQSIISHKIASSISTRSLGRRKRGWNPNPEPTTNTETTQNSSPYSRNFQQNLVDSGIYPPGYIYPDGRRAPKPKNLCDIQQRLLRSRPSLSELHFSIEDYENFVEEDGVAAKEEQITKTVLPIIEGKIKDTKCVSGKVAFANLDSLTDYNLVPGNPDLYDGARPEQLNRKIRDELRGQIIPTTQLDLPIAPNFLLAAKGPNVTTSVAERQACYDGALGARGIHTLQSYGQTEPVYDNNAYTISSIYYAGTLYLYTSHPAPPSGSEGRPEFFMTRLRSFAMTDTVETFRQGATAFRNARDWAKDQRDEAIRQANGRVNGISNTPPNNSALASSSLSGTSATHR